MALTLAGITRNAKVAAATGLMAGGRIRFLTTADAQVAEIAFPSPAFAAPSGGQAFTSGTLVDPFTGSGTIAKFIIENVGGALLLSGTVSLIGDGGDIELSDVAYASGDRLELTSLSYTQPAS